MLAATALGAWMIASCAAALLGSQRYGEAPRALQRLPMPPRAWRLWSLLAQLAAIAVAVDGLGWAVGISAWLSALSLVGAAATGWLSAVPRAASPTAMLATVAALVATLLRSAGP